MRTATADDSDDEGDEDSDGDDDLDIEDEIDRGDPVRPEPCEVVGFEFLKTNYSAKEEILEQERTSVQPTSLIKDRLIISREQT